MTPRRPGPLPSLVPMACLLLAACSTTQPSGPPATPAPTAEAPPAALILGCISIEAAECQFVAEHVVATLPVERGAPFAVEIQLYGCPNEGPCPRTLAVREGKATVEYADRGEPIDFTLAGPPQAPRIAVQQGFWLGLSEPTSPRVAGPGPFPFDLGHCGLTWMVDFDGSFWLPVGSIDGDASATINSERGVMTLLAPNVVEFRGESGFSARLVRFPGPKHIWGCM